MAQYTDIFAATMAATIPVPARYLHEGGIRSGTAEYATATYLDVLGLRPSLGRWFDTTEERPGLRLSPSSGIRRGRECSARILHPRTHRSD